jgi:hypothetical protein
MKKNLLLLFLVTLFFSAAFAQNKESKKAVRDTSHIMKRANRAALYSAVIPGLGQAYNKKYWKLPILYGGGIALGLAIQFNDENYKTFKRAYQYRVDTLSSTVDEFETVYPDAESLLLRKDYYRRTRDLMYIVSGVVYVLQIIDAYVDAHLATFDVSDDLTMRAQPSLQITRKYEPVASMTLSFSLH